MAAGAEDGEGCRQRGAREGGLEVQGLAFSAALHSLIALDATGNPISAVLTWADARAADQSARLRSSPRGLHDRGAAIELRGRPRRRASRRDAARRRVGRRAAGEPRPRGDPAGRGRLLEAAGRAGAGSGGLLFLPQLLGERAPHWSGEPRGAWVGLTRAHGLEHLLRAAVEGVCMQLAIVLAALGDAGTEVGEIRATGGFARSGRWRAILAGVFGRPIGFAASPEGSSLGAALLGMTSLGMLDSLDRAAELVAVTHVERPDPGEAAAYARLLPHFEAIYAALSRTSAALTHLQEVLPVAPQPRPGDS